MAADLFSKITGETSLAAVVGSPISHSLSPAIHNAGFQALGIDAVYLALEFASGDAEKAISFARSLSVIGLSVTMPLKEEICDFVDVLTPAAKALRSCNCIYRDGDKLVGDSTDGTGFVSAFKTQFPDSLDRKTVALLGAGGAARSIAYSLDQTNISEIKVINRTVSSAEKILGLAGKATLGSIDDIENCDVIINATSVGMSGGASADKSLVPETMLRSEHIVADIVYNPLETKLLADARGVGARTIGGVPMLVHQAAEAFFLWTSKKAPLSEMNQAVSTMVV